MNSELSMDQALIEKLTKILEVNLDKEHFGVKDLAKEAGLSRSQLNRKLKNLTNKSPSRYIREFRLKKAMVMLQNDAATASEIAYRVGFSSPTYFNTCFHDYYGYPPGEVKFRNSKVTDIEKESENLEQFDESYLIKDSPKVKKNLLTKKMVWINTMGIILLSVFGYYLYSNYSDFNSKEINDPNTKKKSIAILPFKNLSPDKENQYFADGMMDNTLNHLSSLAGLEVKSRQSAEKYRDSDKSLVEIGKELGANYLLEGSLQKEEDSVRLIIQLIDAKNDNHIWADKYDFELKQVFKVQSEISRMIASELKTAISPEGIEQINKKPTQNLEAYNLYLKGRFFWHRRTEEGINKSIEYYNKAIALDTAYTLAYSGLADSYFVMPWYKVVKNRDSVFTIAKDYAEKALSLDINNAQAHATFGGILCFKDWSWEASEKELKLAIQLNPNYATAHQYYAELLEILGRFKAARKEIDLALNLNPNSFIMTQISGRLYYEDGLYEKAIIEANKAKELNNITAAPYFTIINCYTYMGKDNEAMAEWEEWEKINPNPNMEHIERRRDAFKKSGIKGVWKYENDLIVNSDHAADYSYAIASNLAYFGETEKALDWLESAYEQRHAIYRMKSNPDFKSLRKDPRFLALLKKLNLGDYK